MEDVGAGIGAFDGFDGGSGGSDLVSLWRFPGEKPDLFKSNREDHSVRTSLHTSVAPDSIQLQGGFQASGKLSSSVAKPVVQRDCLKQNFEAFDARAEQTVVPFDCAGKLDPYGENFSPFAATSGPNDFFSLGSETAYGSMFEVCHPDLPWSSMGSSLVYEYESHNLEDAQHKPVMENMEVDLDTVHDFIECLSENSETFRSQVVKSSECPFLNIDHGLNNRGACITGEVDRFETRSACSTSRATLKVQDGSNYIPVLKSQRSEQLFDHMHCGMPSQEIACLKDEQVGEGGKSSNLNEAGDRENFVRDAADHNACSPASVIGGSLGVKSLEQRCPSSEVVTSGEMEPQCVKDETGNGEPILFMDTLSESSHVNSKDCRNCSHIDGVPDICIIEDASQPAPSHQSPSSKTEAGNLQQLKWHHHRAGNMNLRPKNERLYRRVASQDFSQPKSETTPPEGVLAVPLLRHQRIALSWMISQETANLYCSGGILADDQGLGKTVSTIALILKERPPSVRACAEDVRKVASETLNLDDDDDNGNDDNKGDGDQWSKGNQESDEKQVNECSIQRPCPLGQAKGRPAAGTLIVCPTSLLRQWADELGNKVTSKANLSVLVYHGKSRTKDPDELAKYNVVLTTYAIVSMEFPKQPSADGDGDEKERSEGDDTPQMGVLSGKKRKSLPCSDKRGAKHRKGVDSLLLESVCGPLAKVAWFRVVLDEAQSIKNHRTQVARACWGLRAKRRWCLSGTPIQNAVDDLYSYFRFLRCDRYATYKEFCARIKNEISRNPSKGYMRLRAILKLIMLRRTKGTFLDGKPIISLPPKVVELKKVEFSKEEREFYTRLESETSAQFKEYAAAGTVKQNYVNILLMLLRLRQACDHPALVNGSESNPLFSSSVLTAKKIPRKKQIRLLRCLEASLALCRICSDPPEDAVVSICGHVFCNQCISEHLMGDDKQCPAVNCKVQLSLSSVFSKATLEGSVSDNQVRDSYPEDSVSVDSEPVGPCSATKSYDSAKIRAALQVLRSLSQPQDHTSINGGENSSGFQTGGYNGSPGKQRMETCETLKGSGKVIGGKAIVFSQWTRMLDLFEAGLKNCSILYRRLDGTMSVAARDRAVKDFNTLPEVSVIIMSLKAASLGLNLVTASHVLLLDLWWNPTTEDQAIDRAHRIGQTRPVTVLRLTVKDTIEDRILALQKKKRKMVASAFGEDGRGNGSRQSSRFTVEDLQFLFSG